MAYWLLVFEENMKITDNKRMWRAAPQLIADYRLNLYLLYLWLWILQKLVLDCFEIWSEKLIEQIVIGTNTQWILYVKMWGNAAYLIKPIQTEVFRCKTTSKAPKPKQNISLLTTGLHIIHFNF